MNTWSRQAQMVLMGVAVVLSAVANTGAQPAAGPSDAEVESAIAAGLGGTKAPRIGCRAGGGYGQLKGFTVTANGPLNRVFDVAREAKSKYLPFALSAVTEDVRSPAVIVTATPQVPEYNNVGHFWDEARPATHMVMKSRVPKGATPDIVQPASTRLFPIEWANMSGGKRTGQGIAATFDLAAFRTLATKDVDIAIVTERGEKSCTLNAADLRDLK